MTVQSALRTLLFVIPRKVSIPVQGGTFELSKVFLFNYHLAQLHSQRIAYTLRNLSSSEMSVVVLVIRSFVCGLMPELFDL